MSSLFEDTVSAICYSLVSEFFRGESLSPGVHCNHVVRFVLQQHRAAPVYLREPLRVLTLVFSYHSVLKTGKLFHQQEVQDRAEHLRAWKSSRVGVLRNFVRFYESLAVLPWFSESLC